MASLKEIRARIASVSSTKKITSAMKMVSAAKLHKATEQTLRFVPYKDKLSEALSSYLGTLDEEESERLDLPLAKPREVKKVTLVAISSNSGLCGTFNSNVARQLTAAIEDHRRQGHEISVIAIGKKVADACKRMGVDADASRNTLIDKPDYDRSAAFAEELSEMFLSGATDSVELIYNHFKNAGVQIPTREQYLPLTLAKNEGGANTVYFAEPDPVTFVNALLPMVVRIKMYATLMDSSTAEHGARTTAMQIASDNAEKMIGTITQQYNRARQDVITNELIDIVGGSEAQK